MFSATALIIDELIARLRSYYEVSCGLDHAEYANIAAWAAEMALQNIGRSNALYHNVEHTVMVTLVGQEIARGKHIMEGGVTPLDWLHYTISLLCHDIGYVRGVCRGDRESCVMTGHGDETVTLLPGATDAAVTPYHVDRATLFVRQRFGGHGILDAEKIAANIEHTRFPVPLQDDYAESSSYAGLVRAADLIGQLADPQYLRKLPALFYEFEETGTNKVLGYTNPGELRRGYPGFYWNVVNPFIQTGLRHLEVTEEGKQWIANLYAHVFEVEHEAE